MKLSIIIVNYNVKFFLEQCLHSVLKALETIESEVIIVDNNSIDGSCDLIKTKFPEIFLIENKNNVGFSKANNQAIKQSTGEYILLLNPDTLVEKDTFIKIVTFMDNHSDAGGVGVKMIDGKGNFLPESKRGLPTPLVAFYKIFGLSALFPKSKLFGQYHLGYLDKDKTHEVAILSGAFMMMRKSVLDKVGLLDEAFFMYGEDIDLSYRITQAGFKNYYTSDTRIIHYKGESTKKSSINYVFVFYRAMIIFAKKHFSEKNANAFSFLINIAIYLRASIAIFTRIVKNWILPVLDFVFLLAGLFIIKNYYQSYTGIIYSKTLISYALPLYSIIWIVINYLIGVYDFPIKISRTLKGIVLGGSTILIIYALLPESMRFSRAIILLGAVEFTITSLITRFLLDFSPLKEFKIERKTNKRFAIVGSEYEINRVSKLMKHALIQPEFIARISPNKKLNDEDSNFHTSIYSLRDAVEIFKISEIVFCAKDIESNTIIEHMSLLENLHLEFKIAPPDSAFIIGSNSINTSGDVYFAMEINSITKPQNKRMKRLVDIFISCLFIVTTPVSIFFVTNKTGFIANCVRILFGFKSWVGINPSSLQKIPIQGIKSGVLSPDFLSNINDDESVQYINLSYARDYKVTTDITLILKNISSLGN